MRSETVTFYSDGERVSALWRTPDATTERLPSLVHGPGWFGLKDADAHTCYHMAMTDAGLGVLAIDYRGFGDSDGEPSRFSPSRQLEDLINAVTYLTTRDDVDSERLGAFGMGGSGAGNAVLLAAHDERIRAVVAQTPVADGADWLRRMRSEHEWLAYLEMLDGDRRERVLHGKGRLVHPRQEIMIPTPERLASNFKSDVDSRIPLEVSLAGVDELLRYRPLDAAATLQIPLMVIAVENDATTPTDHAERMYEAAAGPKTLVMQRHTSHYAAYMDYGEVLAGEIARWLGAHLQSGAVLVREHDGVHEISRWMPDRQGSIKPDTTSPNEE